MISTSPPRRSPFRGARRLASLWFVLAATAASCSDDSSPPQHTPGAGGAGAGGGQTGGGGAPPTAGVSGDGGAPVGGGSGGGTAGGAGAAGGAAVGGNGGAAVVPTDGMTPPGAPIRLTVGDREHSPNADHVPLFGWWPQDADGNEKQTAYQIKVKQRFGDELVWDSGKVVSEQQSHVPYAGDTALSSGGSYAWTVTTWDATDQMSPESEPAFFDVGLNDSDWDANWIRRSSNEADDYTLARAELSVGASPVVRARAYVAAVHQYVLYAGGQEVERGLAYAHPDQGYYQATDITEQVTAGQPLAIGVIYRWYGSGQGRPAGQRGLLVRVVVDHEDGSQDVLVTDSNWRVRRASQWRTGAPKRNGDGSDYVEQIDARQEPAGWTDAGYNASSWEAPQVIGMHPTNPFTHLNAQEPRVAQIPIKPVSVTQVGGNVVADFGNVIPARPRVQFASGSAGRQLNMSGGYLLSGGGNVNTSTAANQDTDLSFDFTQAAGATVFEAYTHVGFRYLQIPDPGETLTADHISAFIEHTDAPEDLRATFESSDETLNAVFAMLSRSAIYGVQGQFVDTPTREKGQFLGDTASISYATMRGHHERDSTEKAIFEFVDSQRRHWSDGRMNAVYPNGDGARDIPDYTLMFVNWVWQYYLETGNKTLLEAVYPVLVNIKDYALRYRNNGTGLIHNLAGGSGDYQYGIIDWPIPGRFGFDMNTAARTPVNIQTVDVLRKVALAARALGRPESEAEGLEQQAAELTTAINTQLRRADGVYIDGLASAGNPSSHASQHANSYAIAFGVVPADGLDVVADYVESLGMQQGPMTSHWLLRGLGEAEKEAALLERLTDESELGWAKILADGGTFTWESWTARAEGHSESHSWGAQVLVDVLEYLLGVRLAAPGASQIDIVPPKTVLDSAKGSVFTQRGEVHVEWQRPTPTTFQLTVKVPVNVRARVLLPTAEEAQVTSSGTGMPQALGLVGDRVGFDVGSGTTSFTIAAP